MSGIEFDEKTHTYRHGGMVVPHVTAVLQDLIPGWPADEWRLRRGSAIHYACQLIVQGKRFHHDRRIAGPVAACRKFCQTFKIPTFPPPLTEQRFFDPVLSLAGTVDLIAPLGHKGAVVIDWKSSFSPALSYQLAAYCLLSKSRYGVGVQLEEDGEFKMSQVYDFKFRDRKYQRGFLAMLEIYRIRTKLQLTAEEKTDVPT